jgi:formyl transferase-like protein
MTPLSLSPRSAATCNCRGLSVRTLLICHQEDDMDRLGLAGWLAARTELAGILVLRETRGRRLKRIRREIRRVGLLRFLDVIAFRFYYAAVLQRQDRRWERTTLDRLNRIYPAPSPSLPTLVTNSPNTPAAEHFIKALAPDLMIARCKTLLARRIFSLPRHGTFVMHPGTCPEYRNAHGCFWAFAHDDLERVGMTLLQIDDGVDTGPVYGYFPVTFDEVHESHIVVQHRTVFDNLPAIESLLAKISCGTAVPIDTQGRTSGIYGQPWLSQYLRWKWRARRKHRQ